MPEVPVVTIAEIPDIDQFSVLAHEAAKLLSEEVGGESELLINTMKSEEGHCVVALDSSGKLLGSALFSLAPMILYVDEIGVTAEARSDGIGTMLLLAVEEFALQHDKEAIGLVPVNGFGLYRKNGFEMIIDGDLTYAVKQLGTSPEINNSPKTNSFKPWLTGK